MGFGLVNSLFAGSHALGRLCYVPEWIAKLQIQHAPSEIIFASENLTFRR
jgi:hypothetical protein